GRIGKGGWGRGGGAATAPTRAKLVNAGRRIRPSGRDGRPFARPHPDCSFRVFSVDRTRVAVSSARSQTDADGLAALFLVLAAVDRFGIRRLGPIATPSPGLE